MKMIPNNVKKEEARKFFIGQSPKFYLYTSIIKVAGTLSWLLPVGHILIKVFSYGLSGRVIPGYAYISAAITAVMLYAAMRFLGWGLKKVCNMEYHQYPFDKDEESLEFTAEGNLLFRYHVGKKHYMDRIRIASVEVRSECNAVAVTGWIQQYAVKGEKLSLRKEGKDARVFFDYYNPSIIKQFDK